MIVRSAILCAVCFLFACEDSTAPTAPSAFEVNLAKWQTHSTGNYQFHFMRYCFCGRESLGPFHVFVRDDEVDSVVNLYDTTVVPDSLLDEHRTIDGLFAWYDSVAATDPFYSTITYDSVLGFPDSVYVDFLEYAIDEEYGFLIDSVIVEN